MPANPARIIYGTILVAALLAAESPRRETYPKTVAAVAIALTLYWLANSYAEFTGDRVRKEEPFETGVFVRTARFELAVIYGALGPLVAVLVCWAAGATLSTAVLVGIWTSVAIIIVGEIVIGIRAELTGRQLLVQTGMGIFLGLLIVVLRVVLH